MFFQFPLHLIWIRGNRTLDRSIPRIKGACHNSSWVYRVDVYLLSFNFHFIGRILFRGMLILVSYLVDFINSQKSENNKQKTMASNVDKRVQYKTKFIRFTMTNFMF